MIANHQQRQALKQSKLEGKEWIYVLEKERRVNFATGHATYKYRNKYWTETALLVTDHQSLDAHKNILQVEPFLQVAAHRFQKET